MIMSIVTRVLRSVTVCAWCSLDIGTWLSGRYSGVHPARARSFSTGATAQHVPHNCVLTK